ncbi:MAG: 50S ribosomal protein L5 [Spartobacteria bacterium]|nr:50S ribosomal protein L5 [Spartobacteria bacterium]
MANLKDKYKNTIAPEILKESHFSNVMEVPKVEKIVLNMGFKVTVDKDMIKALVSDVAAITGQQPIVTKARRSVANFKLREGMPIGIKVTLRGDRMYEFLDRLINATLPRIRDFRGVSGKAFDQHGNYTLGLKEQIMFPEINPDKVKITQGMDITIVTTAKNKADGYNLLKHFGMPFANA